MANDGVENPFAPRGAAARRAARERAALAASLGRSGDPAAVPALLRLLEARPPVRAAVDALRRLGEPGLARAIGALLDGDPAPVADVKDPRLAGPLLALLGDRAAWRRAAAAEALG